MNIHAYNLTLIQYCRSYQTIDRFKLLYQYVMVKDFSITELIRLIRTTFLEGIQNEQITVMN